MKKNKIEFFYPILASIASIIVCVFLWDKIIAPYSNPYEIIGEYSKHGHSTHNDTMRYILFITLPILSFFTIFILRNKKNKDFNFNKSIFFFKKEKKYENLEIKFLIIILIPVVLLFLFDDWNMYSTQLFEEGMPLSGSMLSKLNQIPWINVYINTGLFYDMLNARISWNLTGHETIGSYKFFLKFLNLLSKILLIYFFYKISSQTFERKNLKELFFLFLSLTFLFFFGKNDFWREIPLIIFLISILNYTNNKNNFYIFLVSFISVFSFFWSLDRGFFILLPLILFLLLVFINNKKEFFKFIFSIILFWLIAILIMGPSTFINFLIHAREIFTQHELINGLIHPKPFSTDEHSARASKAFLLIIFNFIYSFYLIFKKKSNFLNNTKILFIIFSFMNFFIYKSALSRSDGGHIKYATYFSLILFLIFATSFLISYLRKKENFFKKKKNLFPTVYLIFIFVILINQVKSIKNLVNFPVDIKNIIIANDEKFISKDHFIFIKDLDELLNDSDCVQTFSYDNSIFYFLKKKSCSKFFNLWTVGSKKNQKLYINELITNKPKFIITEGPVKFQNLGERYPYIQKFISQEYNSYKVYDAWKILKKID